MCRKFGKTGSVVRETCVQTDKQTSDKQTRVLLYSAAGGALTFRSWCYLIVICTSFPFLFLFQRCCMNDIRQQGLLAAFIAEIIGNMACVSVA